MFTEQIATLGAKLREMGLDDGLVAAFEQLLGSCSQTLSHRGTVNLPGATFTQVAPRGNRADYTEVNFDENTDINLPTTTTLRGALHWGIAQGFATESGGEYVVSVRACGDRFGNGLNGAPFSVYCNPTGGQIPSILAEDVIVYGWARKQNGGDEFVPVLVNTYQVGDGDGGGSGGSSDGEAGVSQCVLGCGYWDTDGCYNFPELEASFPAGTTFREIRRIRLYPCSDGSSDWSDRSDLSDRSDTGSDECPNCLRVSGDITPASALGDYYQLPVTANGQCAWRKPGTNWYIAWSPTGYWYIKLYGSNAVWRAYGVVSDGPTGGNYLPTPGLTTGVATVGLCIGCDPECVEIYTPATPGDVVNPWDGEYHAVDMHNGQCYYIHVFLPGVVGSESTWYIWWDGANWIVSTALNGGNGETDYWFYRVDSEVLGPYMFGGAALVMVNASECGGSSSGSA